MALKANIEQYQYNRKEIINLFSKANQNRLENARKYLNKNQQDFLDLLPYLFHYNDEELPGFVSTITPSGISQYQPIQQSIKKAKSLFPKYKHIRRAKHQMDIHALFLMGSAGSIAYSQKSDFDFWLIHAPDLDASSLDELSLKTKLIEQWADSLKLEVHFFCFDSNSFRSGQHQSLSTESSGSTQHSLLLDEFYRSNILIAGRKPIWWMIPAENDHQYSQYLGILEYGKIITPSDYVDLGTPCPIPTSEFFSAAVWQLYKAINSPYKSVLKLLLMEVYANQHPKTELLSSQFKDRVYKGIDDYSELDPYVIMYEAVEKYLTSNNEYERLDIFRQCFYFKVGEKLSKKILKRAKSERRVFLESMMHEWGWDNSKFSLLDMSHKWRIDDLIKHRKKIVNTLTKSYNFLSDFAKQNPALQRVSETELNVLGRKLYSAFEKKNHKIELINQSSQDLYEPEVTLHETVNSDSQKIWNLYRGKLKLNEIAEYKPLKNSYDIMEMITWCHINKVVNQHSAILLHTNEHGITTREIKDTFHALEQFLSISLSFKATFSDLSKPARIISAGIFINVGLDPLNISKNDIRHIASNRQDAFSYGGKHQNLVRSIDMVLLTSWEEVLVYHYKNIPGLMNCLSDFLSWIPQEEHYNTTDFHIFSLSTGYGRSIANRIEKLSTNIIDIFFKHNKEKIDIKYILEAEDTFHLLDFTQNNIIHKFFKHQEGLNKYLESSPIEFSEVIFDNENKWTSALPQIYQLNKRSIIQTFYEIENNSVKIYVVDEKGSLFEQTIAFHNTHSLISHFDRFYKSISNRKNFMMGELLEKEILDIEFYEIRSLKNRKKTVTKIDLKPNSKELDFFNIQVIGSMDDTDKNQLTIYCNDQEFSSIEYGKDILNIVAEYVISKRETSENYPIYITDIDFSKNILDIIDPQNVQTVHFLKYKKKIEENLNNALKNITK